MKKLLVVFLALAMILAFAATALAADTEIPDYTDMADQSAAWQAAVYRLTALGVLEGNNGVGGAFRPADYITRAELAKIVVYLTGNTDKVSYYAAQAPAFTDVTDGYWAEGYINACKDLGLMKGVGYGLFNPTGTVTFQETATVVLRALGYTDALKGEWPSDYSRKAAEIGLTEYVDYIGPKAISRAELASIFNEGLDKLMVSYIADSTAQGLSQVFALTAQQIAWYFGEYIDEDAVDEYYTKDFGVDADGFAYNIFYTNDDDRSTNRDLLYYAFEATAAEVQFNDEPGALSVAPDDKEYSEANAWGYDDFDDGELLLASYVAADYSEDPEEDDNDFCEDEVASLYYIYGGGLTDLADMQANVTYNDDGEVLFVELTSQKIKVDAWDDLDLDDSDDEFTDLDGDKVEVADTKYKVKVSKGFQLNDSLPSETVNEEGGFGYLFVDKDGNAYDYKDYYQFANAGHHVIDSVDDSYVYFLDDAPAQRISKLDDYVILKDGEFAEISDLENGDVIYQAPLKVGDAVTMFIVLSPVTGGDLTKAYTDDDTSDGTDYGFTVDGDRYYGYTHNSNKYCYYSLDGLDSLKDYAPNYELRDEFFDEEVTYAPAYAWRDFVYASIDIESYSYGVITDLDYTAYTQTDNILSGVTIMMADGTEQSYDLDDEFYNIFSNNELIWTIGSFVEFELNKDGEIITADGVFGSPDMWFKYAGGWADSLAIDRAERPFSSRYDWSLATQWDSFPYGLSDNDYSGTLTSNMVDNVIYDTDGDYLGVAVSVDEDDATVEFDGETYDLADDAEIFVVSVDDWTGAYDDCDIETAADLLADGDFDAWQISACYTSGLYGTTIDTLWIVSKDVEGDVQMGYENGGKDYDADDYYAKLNDNDEKSPVSWNVYSNWNKGFIAYALDGDTIEDSYEFITFYAGDWNGSAYTTLPYVYIPDYDAVNEDYLLNTTGLDVSTMGDFMSNTDDTLASFRLNDGETKTYNITLGVVDGIDESHYTIALDGNSWNSNNDDTYRYGSIVFFADKDSHASAEATDIEDLNTGDVVLIVRSGANVLYAFRLLAFDTPVVPAS